MQLVKQVMDKQKKKVLLNRKDDCGAVHGNEHVRYMAKYNLTKIKSIYLATAGKVLD